MFPLLPIELIQKQEATKLEEGGSPNVNQEQFIPIPSLVVVDEQPPKVKDIKPINLSPAIEMSFMEAHFIGKNMASPCGKFIFIDKL